jgi:MoaA/NifB/PqqE/SkfB family radical SAM enzyme
MEVLLARGNPRNPDAAKVSIERFKAVAAWLDQEAPGPKSFMDRVRRELAREKRGLIVETVSQNRMALPCLAGRKLIVLAPDGKVRPCEMLETLYPSPPPGLGLENFLMGDLRESDYDLGSILKNDAAGKLRDFIDHSSCHCSYECAALADLAFRPASVFKIFLKALY